MLQSNTGSEVNPSFWGLRDGIMCFSRANLEDRVVLNNGDIQWRSTVNDYQPENTEKGSANNWSFAT